jgi:hypothetical protein
MLESVDQISIYSSFPRRREPIHPPAQVDGRVAASDRAKEFGSQSPGRNSSRNCPKTASLRAKRSNPGSPREALGCFAARARHLSVRRASAPLCASLSTLRLPGITMTQPSRQSHVKSGWAYGRRTVHFGRLWRRRLMIIEPRRRGDAEKSYSSWRLRGSAVHFSSNRGRVSLALLASAPAFRPRQAGAEARPTSFLWISR